MSNAVYEPVELLEELEEVKPLEVEVEVDESFFSRVSLILGDIAWQMPIPPES